ncbi:MAG: GNAT family N-acetyltransferase [Aeoliella sp.]
MTSIILTTARLQLRRMHAGDLDFLAEMLADPEVMRHYPKVFNRQEAGDWLDKVFKRYEEDGHAFWLVENRSTGEPIGQCGLLAQQVNDAREMEIGYMLHRRHWRQGYAHEAASGVRDWAIEELDASRLVSLIRPANIPSQRVALSYGAKPEKLVVWRDLEHLVFSLHR